MQAFEDEVARRFERRRVLDRRAHLAVDEDMSVSRLRAQPSREIDHRSDRAVVAASLDSVPRPVPAGGENGRGDA